MKQEWYCSGCGVRGTCTIPKGAGVYEGVERLAAAHRRKSVICNALNVPRKIRVRNPELLTPKAWRELIHKENEDREHEQEKAL